MYRKASSLAAFFLLGSLVLVPAHGSEVNLRGKVEDVSQTQNQFFVDCTSVELTSGQFDLNAFVGLQVRLTGNWNGSSTAPSVDVTAIEVVPETFEIGGNGDLGGELQFKVTSNPGDFTVMFASLNEGFGPSRRGVLFLGPPLFTIGFGTIPGGGNLEIKVSIPDDPALDGLTVLGQAIVGFAAGGSISTNPDCATINQ